MSDIFEGPKYFFTSLKKPSKYEIKKGYKASLYHDSLCLYARFSQENTNKIPQLVVNLFR